MQTVSAEKEVNMSAMMSIRDLCKKYPAFELKNISFSVEPGYIVGFIGRNGAGKTTTIKSILGLTSADGGSVELFGLDMRKNEAECKRQLGVVFGEFGYYADKKLKTITSVYRRFYPEWDDARYHAYLQKFGLDENKRVKELSSGMKVKYSLALALSHNAKLLILDEPTSGLDPVSRDELTDIFRDIVADGEHSIIFSTHVTSDLDKCADYIIYIRNGEIIMQGDREEIISGYSLVQGCTDELTSELEQALIGIKETPFGFTGLISENDIYLADGLQCAKADIESIMVYTEKYEHHEGGEQ